MSTAVHEASHVAAAILLDRPVEHVLVQVGASWVGEELGHARIPVGERLEVGQVPICLVGYWSEDRPGWPPSYEDALIEERESLGLVLRLLGATEAVYDDLVDIARRMLADPIFIRLRDAIARALRAVPRLEGEDIERLAAIYLPDEEETTCST